LLGRVYFLPPSKARGIDRASGVLANRIRYGVV
jgi:hypothetical protein